MSQEAAAPEEHGKTLMKLRQSRVKNIAAIFLAAGALTVGIPVISSRAEAERHQLDQTKNDMSLILKFREKNEYVYRKQCGYDVDAGLRKIENSDQQNLCISEKAVNGHAYKIAQQEAQITKSSNLEMGATALLSLSVAFFAAFRTRRINNKIHDIKQSDFRL